MNNPKPRDCTEPGPYGIGSKHWPGVGKAQEEQGELGLVFGKLAGSGGDRDHWSGDLVFMMQDEIADVRASLRYLEEANPVLNDLRPDLPAIPNGYEYMKIREAWKLNLFRSWGRGDHPDWWPQPEDYGLPPRGRQTQITFDADRTKPPLHAMRTTAQPIYIPARDTPAPKAEQDKPSEPAAKGWQAIDITTPEAWHGFFARQLGKTSWCLAAAVSWHAWYVGLQLIGGNNREVTGLALALGPLWIGVGRLKPAEGDEAPKEAPAEPVDGPSFD
ncbi:hypothetical protein [Erythrobacter aureus]|uniref:Uncharacterized protein n=1 Tax=Erythrobacter aureus TaxID=2182384 RepID=A0A345YJ78_9SPHN|nr:hypothetical protein [Erythrobacter aureus]AXK43980.1 hypothetical protein DVR09_16125 [Erythrobacter aureus]